MTANKFLHEVHRIFRILFIQKAVTQFLRAAWLGGAAYLLFWGTNQLWGWFPDQGRWVWYSAGLSVLVFGSVFLKRKPTKGFVWRLDRSFKLKEQVYTAYENLDAGEEVGVDPGMQALLGSEAVNQLPKIRRQIVDQGGHYRREFESTIVVLILLLIVYLANVGNISRLPGGFGSGFLPLLGRDPTASDVFSGGIPGETRENEPSEGVGGTTSIGDQAGDLDLDPQDWEDITEALENLGEKLEGQSASQELGQALRGQDFGQAAEEFSAMAEEIDEFSDGTRHEMADDFLETSVELQQIGQSEIGSQFSAATSALLGDSLSDMAESLDNLSELMEKLKEYQAKQPAADLDQDLTPSSAQPLNQGVGEVFDLDTFGLTQDFISVPGSGTMGGSETLGEAVDFVMPYTTSTGEGIWLPYDISMDDSDVVSEYFSPR